MTELETRLGRLLAGDFVRLETADLSVRAEVVTNDLAALDDPVTAAPGGHTVSFMPIGERGRAVEADRFHVTLEPADGPDWAVGPLMADVFDESKLTYVTKPLGPLVAVEPLQLDG